MGLFSGSFGTGLVKGLATSVDASLKSAMEKRDEEMSRARTFWQTRQAQKMDAAEAKDERAGDALTRLIEEFNGDVAKDIATYKGLGGSLDSVESFIKEIDDTRNAGMSYNLDDKVKFEGIDLSQFADLSYEDAFSTIRTEVKPLDIQMSDMSGLSKIGLGIDNMGQQVSKGVNELIPARTKTNISGLTGAVIDRSGTYTGIMADLDMRSKVGNIATQLGVNARMLSTGLKLDNETPLSEDERIRLEENQANLLILRSNIAKADAAGDDKSAAIRAATSALGTAWSRVQSIWNDDMGYSTSGGTTTAIIGGQELVGEEAASAYQAEITRRTNDWITNNLLDETGEFVSGGDEMASLYGLTKKAEAVQSSIKTALQEESATETAPETPEATASQDTVGVDTTVYDGGTIPNANQFLADLIEERPNIMNNPNNITVIADAMAKAGVPQDQIDAALAPYAPASAEEPTSEPASEVGNVPPMPSGMRPAAQWRAKYGQTHNPDGTPKRQ